MTEHGRFLDVFAVIDAALKDLPEDVQYFAMKVEKLKPSLTTGPRNNCFVNAAVEYQAQIQAGKNPTYVIGKAYTTKPGSKYDQEQYVPGYQHAWVEVDGKVVDPTSMTSRRRMYLPGLRGGLDLNPNQMPRQPVVLNAFCPTGKGGGIDPSCSWARDFIDFRSY